MLEPYRILVFLFVGGYLNIICALVNTYRKTTNTFTESQKLWATRILMLHDKENQLQKRLQEINDSNNKPQWKKYDAQMVNFPILSEDNVQTLCFGNVSLFNSDNI